VDADNSGSVDFEEFLLLAIPGFTKSRKTSKPRGFAVHNALHAMYQDAEGCTSDALDEFVVEIPEQCMRRDEPELDSSRPGEPTSQQPTRRMFVELRLRFKRAINDNLGRTESASGGNIILPLRLMKDNWIECSYPFDDKQLAHSASGSGILFIAPPPPDPHKYPMPLSKLKCVKFPEPSPKVMEDGQPVDGFRILSVSPDRLIITFDMKYGKYANFGPPPNDLIIIQTGAGTTVDRLKVGGTLLSCTRVNVAETRSQYTQPLNPSRFFYIVHMHK
jgi:hypothetical protein